MTVLLALTALAALWKIRFTGKQFHPDCLSKDTTTAINGIFVLLVFFRHFSQYIAFGRFDRLFVMVDHRLDQLIVAPFLFFSGYGIMCSIEKKGIPYVNQIPTRRFLKIWTHFALAIVLFAVTRVILGRHDSLKQILLSFTGWESIGNSNWYIFATLALYLMTFLAFRISRGRTAPGILGTLLLCCGYIVVISRYKSHWWYDTLLSFPAGMVLAALRPRISGKLRKNRVYLPVLLGTAALFLVFFKFRKTSVWMYEGLSVLFVLLIVLMTEKLVIGNPVLRFLGTYTFEIYILQRIPMMLLEEWMPTGGIWKVPYFLLCFGITIGLSVLFRKFTKAPDALLDRMFSGIGQLQSRKKRGC